MSARERGRQPRGVPVGGEYAKEAGASTGIALSPGQVVYAPGEGVAAANQRRDADIVRDAMASDLRAFDITSAFGTRTWWATEDEDARWQHTDAFGDDPEEAIETVTLRPGVHLTDAERAIVADAPDADLSAALHRVELSLDPDHGSRRDLFTEMVREEEHLGTWSERVRVISGRFAAIDHLHDTGIAAKRCAVCCVTGAHHDRCGMTGDDQRITRTTLAHAREAAADADSAWGPAGQDDGILTVLSDRDLDPEVLARLSPVHLAKLDREILDPAIVRIADGLRTYSDDFRYHDDRSDLGNVNDRVYRQAMDADLPIFTPVLSRAIAGGTLRDEHAAGIDTETLTELYWRHLGPAIDQIEDRLVRRHGR